MTDGEDNSDNRKFVSWVLGLNASVFMLGIAVVGSILWQGNTTLARMQAVNESLVTRVTALESQITAAATSRYTATDASTDRNTLTAMINSMRDSWTSMMRDVATGDREQSARLAALELWRAKIEQKMEGK